MNVNTTKLPYYFYSLDATLPDGRLRWRDEYANESDVVFRPEENTVEYQRRKAERNMAYSMWQASFFHKLPTGECIPAFKSKTLKWQAIRVLSFKHSESSEKDWWENYQDVVFRVFVNPETVYDEVTGEHKQWYLLSPEDCFLVNRHEIEKVRPGLVPPRDMTKEKFLVSGPEFRKARFIPVECCHHLRHETTGGVLPEGL